MDAEERAALYAADRGAEARLRQEQLARDRFPCCWEDKEAGHHPVCPCRPDDPVVEVVEGQESLV